MVTAAICAASIACPNLAQQHRAELVIPARQVETMSSARLASEIMHGVNYDDDAVQTPLRIRDKDQAGMTTESDDEISSEPGIFLG